jgi:hypothetical protein
MSICKKTEVLPVVCFGSRNIEAAKVSLYPGFGSGAFGSATEASCKVIHSD